MLLLMLNLQIYLLNIHKHLIKYLIHFFLIKNQYLEDVIIFLKQVYFFVLMYFTILKKLNLNLQINYQNHLPKLFP